MQAESSGPYAGGNDVSVYEEAAIRAAQRGDVDELELNLARLRLAAPAAADDLTERLRGLAECVRDHPSFRRSSGSQRPAHGLAG